MLDKSAQTFMAPALARHGAMVVIPNYTLAPAVGLEDISLEIAQALAWVWQHAHRFGGDRDRIVVAGHSAGGHLTGMALSLDGKALGRTMGLSLPCTLAARGVAISGLFDLAPLQHCEWLMPDIRLTPESIARLSPAGWAAPKGRRMLAVAGELESSEFHRQNALIRQAWGAKAVPLVEKISGRNHFDILLDLMDDQSRLFSLVAGELGLGD
jgi:arylformamidase